MLKTVLSALPVLAALSFVTPAAQAASDNGTISIVAKGAAVGVGYTWGDGILRYRGHTYHFSVKGISVADVGYSEVHATGVVNHLKRIQDFSGTYAASSGQVTIDKGIGGMALINPNGVTIRMKESTRGARLTGAADGIVLTLK